MVECRPLATADESITGLPEQVAEVMKVSVENIKRYAECKETHKGLVQAVKKIQEEE